MFVALTCLLCPPKIDQISWHIVARGSGSRVQGSTDSFLSLPVRKGLFGNCSPFSFSFELLQGLIEDRFLHYRSNTR